MSLPHIVPHLLTGRVEYLSQRSSLDKFAKSAAASFAAHPNYWSYTNEEIDPLLLALRWGCNNQAVLVCKLDECFQPIIYGDMIPNEQ